MTNTRSIPVRSYVENKECEPLFREYPGIGWSWDRETDKPKEPTLRTRWMNKKPRVKEDIKGRTRSHIENDPPKLRTRRTPMTPGGHRDRKILSQPIGDLRTQVNSVVQESQILRGEHPKRKIIRELDLMKRESEKSFKVRKEWSNRLRWILRSPPNEEEKGKRRVRLRARVKDVIKNYVSHG
ncbi:hypothetical protein C922_05376 [Plasmodium inui San Antonio 1]|uniref:Uncharacterized protein n=1 Tax=Plasmodium inui San Antonio 1 TaxID=1237626 RepID=W6ZY71_9APIC|nr:hypothetical protein C922_05376 [Plasmodium inui San Antonio 1]EUD64245.1 hypothetical protein C922_05376 [Plasmodium inui San Antonio 1]